MKLKFSLNPFKKNNSTPNATKGIIKTTFNKSILIFGVVFLAGSMIFNQLTPVAGKNQVFLNLNNTIKSDPNFSESDFQFFKDNTEKYVLSRSVILNSNFTPLFKWLQPKQVETLRKFTVYYYLQYVENNISNIYFKYKMDRADIENIKSFQDGTYQDGIIVNFPMNQISNINGDYKFTNQLGIYETNAIINDVDEINAINVLIPENKQDIYLVCKKISTKGYEYNFSDCKTEYGAAVSYFGVVWKNINNVPDFVNMNARLFYEYNSLVMQGLDKTSYCYQSYPIIKYDEFYKQCKEDYDQAIYKINHYISGRDKISYIQYSQDVSKSLKINKLYLTPAMGFEPIGYKSDAIVMLQEKYNQTNSSDKNWMIRKIVDKNWNPKYPKITLDVSGYSQQDIYNITHAESMIAIIKENNKKRDIAQKKIDDQIFEENQFKMKRELIEQQEYLATHPMKEINFNEVEKLNSSNTISESGIKHEESKEELKDNSSSPQITNTTMDNAIAAVPPLSE